MRRSVLIALMTLVPLAAVAQTAQPVVVGASYTVNDSTGAQTDPHVSGDLVAYTNVPNNEIRYHRLSLGVDNAIPNNGAFDAVSDVYGDLIVFTRNDGTKRAIHLFDTTSGTSSEIDPQPGSIRNFASIGGNTVAWEDTGITGDTAQTEILVYDVIAGGAPIRLTNDTLDDRDPAVSPNGEVISFTKCNGTACDIYVARWNGSAWITSALVTSPLVEGRSSTDGSIVAYESLNAATGDRDIAYVSVNGGSETRLTLSGTEQNPSVSGGLIAFERTVSGGFSSSNTDILLYDVATGLLYSLTNTADKNERLTDIDMDPATGLVRVVYVQEHPDGENVYAFTFMLQSPTPCEEPADNGCADTTGRPVLTSMALTRAPGQPSAGIISFAATPGDALICIENGEPSNRRATVGWVTLNGNIEADPSDFNPKVAMIERRVSVSSSNVLTGMIVGGPGSSFTATVYGPPAKVCSSTGASMPAEALKIKGVGDKDIRSIEGRKLRSGAAPEPLLETSLEPIEGVGCSSSGAASAGFAIFALALLIVRTQRRCAVAVRRR